MNPDPLIPDTQVIYPQPFKDSSYIHLEMQVYIEKFINDFQLTNEEKDFIRSKNIQEWIDENGFKGKRGNLTITKFALELKKYILEKGLTNIYNKYKKLNGKCVMCWFGIKK